MVCSYPPGCLGGFVLGRSRLGTALCTIRLFLSDTALLKTYVRANSKWKRRNPNGSSWGFSSSASLGIRVLGHALGRRGGAAVKSFPAAGRSPTTLPQAFWADTKRVVRLMSWKGDCMREHCVSKGEIWAGFWSLHHTGAGGSRNGGASEAAMMPQGIFLGHEKLCASFSAPWREKNKIIIIKKKK